ncbi:nitroreductase family protein [Mesoplasma seiffertii]|uniref:nitroreductase family protein n=1 Tax=Mesoplasma seiffertii TaxID=28224 RepID=UPI0006844CBA|nr:nitroreductase family protein [Mesoplasma seiffertii]
MNQTVKQLMQNRHSARRFDVNYEIADHDLDQIVEAIRMSPASYGALNTRVVVMKKGAFKDSLNKIFYNQDNFTQASAYIIFVNDKAEIICDQTMPYTTDLIFKDQIEKKEAFLQNFYKVWNYRFGTPETLNLAEEWSMKQSYIALGVGIVAAASLNIDTCPHEGLDKAALETVLREHGLITEHQQVAVGLALGKIDQSIINSHSKEKVRMPIEKFRIDVK